MEKYCTAALATDENMLRRMCFAPWIKRLKDRLVGAFSALHPKADCTLTPQMSSFIHLQRRHAPYRSERPLLVKEGTVREFS